LGKRPGPVRKNSFSRGCFDDVGGRKKGERLLPYGLSGKEGSVNPAPSPCAKQDPPSSGGDQEKEEKKAR